MLSIRILAIEINTVSCKLVGFNIRWVHSKRPAVMPCFCCCDKLKGDCDSSFKKSVFALSDEWAIAFLILYIYLNLLLSIPLLRKSLLSPTIFLALLCSFSKSCQVLKLSGWSICSIKLLARINADFFVRNFFTLCSTMLLSFSASSRISC